ncbi:MAG: hypothetical protein MI866_11305 [Bacteroidales bacterium]|nr:hypothetical protein [Bacteroidales bacterium]
MPKPEAIPHNINKYKDRLPDWQAYMNESGQYDLKFRFKTKNLIRQIQEKTPLKPLWVAV